MAVVPQSLDGLDQRPLTDLMSADHKAGPCREIHAREIRQLAHQAGFLSKLLLQADQPNCRSRSHASPRPDEPNTNARWGHRRGRVALGSELNDTYDCP